MRDNNERFNEYHREIDYFLRLSRMNTSDMMESQNRMALNTIWDSVLRLKSLTEQANDKLIYIAIEVGNQDPCIVALFNELQEAELRAGTNISACASTMHRQQETAIASGFFNTVDYTQRSSHFLQIITLYTLGLHNTVTEQNEILAELNGIWAERELIKAEDRLLDEHTHILVSLQTARINLNNCMLVIEGMYESIADDIYNRAGGCRRK